MRKCYNTTQDDGYAPLPVSAPGGIRTLTSEETGLSDRRGCRLRHQRVPPLGFEPRKLRSLSATTLPICPGRRSPPRTRTEKHCLLRAAALPICLVDRTSPGIRTLIRRLLRPAALPVGAARHVQLCLIGTDQRFSEEGRRIELPGVTLPTVFDTVCCPSAVPSIEEGE